MNEHLYDMHSRARQIEIPSRDANPRYYDYVFQHPARWVRDDVEEELSSSLVKRLSRIAVST